ncbi:MAG TPA: hypothetical protein VGM05_05170 [Planctomycetaceae bacterium]
MIHFDCQCGKALKAPPKLAGTVGCCPACGSQVAVPHPLVADNGPGEQSEVYALAAEPPIECIPDDQPAFVPSTTPRDSFRRDPIDAWLETIQGTKFVAAISAILALLTALGIELYPHVLQSGIFWLSGLFLVLAWAGVVAVVLGYGCQLLDSALECEPHGGRQPEMPDLDPGPAVTSFVKWASCFVAGPAFLLYEALRYWVLCGDLTVGDGLILGELTVSAIGYWLIAVLVLTKRPELVVPLPWHVLKAARNLGARIVPAGIVLTVAAGVHLWLGVNALVLLHSSWLVGWILLWICWFSVWQCGALAQRTLGSWHVRSERTRAESTMFPVPSRR